MNFIEQYYQLKQIFNPQLTENMLLDSSIRIFNLAFHSANSASEKFTNSNEQSIRENFTFSYPVMRPQGPKQFDKAILYLHGLNERNWSKHLVCARFLAEKTGRPVILFPLSYHMNRGLPEWSDIHRMSILLESRKKKFPGLREASIANLALSERLTEHPERFYYSGQQTATDIVNLLREIRDGRHPLFVRNCRIDNFAYSIGCMLLQTLMLTNPENLFLKSSFVFFAGGCLFSDMNGISKYIMDNVASESIKKYFLEKDLNTLEQKLAATDNIFRKAAQVLIRKDFCKSSRLDGFENYRENILIIALKNDQVIPVEGIASAFGDNICNSGAMRIMHFPYVYSHENPFPVLNRNLEIPVTEAFLSVFEPVTRFFMGERNHTLSFRRRKTDYKATA